MYVFLEWRIGEYIQNNVYVDAYIKKKSIINDPEGEKQEQTTSTHGSTVTVIGNSF